MNGWLKPKALIQIPWDIGTSEVKLSKTGIVLGWVTFSTLDF
jgi:hypothetical protein